MHRCRISRVTLICFCASPKARLKDPGELGRSYRYDLQGNASSHICSLLHSHYPSVIASLGVPHPRVLPSPFLAVFPGG